MRGWAARSVAADLLARRQGEAGARAEALLRKWLSAKQRYESSENVPGASSALTELIRRRTGRLESEIRQELSEDESLSEGTRKTMRQYREFALHREAEQG